MQISPGDLAEGLKQGCLGEHCRGFQEGTSDAKATRTRRTEHPAAQKPEASVAWNTETSQPKTRKEESTTDKCWIMECGCLRNEEKGQGRA